MAKSIAAEERFWAKVNKTESCWLWTASGWNGYGQFWDGSRLVRAHRFCWELLRGPIPEGLVLDHLCRVPACVNPDHLEPVTQTVNIARGDAWSNNLNTPKTHCVHGHPFDDENTYHRKDRRGRMCIACKKARRLASRSASKIA